MLYRGRTMKEMQEITESPNWSNALRNILSAIYLQMNVLHDENPWMTVAATAREKLTLAEFGLIELDGPYVRLTAKGCSLASHLTS